MGQTNFVARGRIQEAGREEEGKLFLHIPELKSMRQAAGGISIFIA